MLAKKKEHPKEKTKLHPRSKHRERYDFNQLIASCKELRPFVILTAYDDESIDFSNPQAVKMLNKALLQHYYDITDWDIPAHYLCPPVPGRADYIHHIADILRNNNAGQIPTGAHIKCLDIGVGANCIYPIIGTKEYGWSFIGSDIDPVSIAAATKTVAANATLGGKIELRLQNNPKDIFVGIIKKDEFIDLTICNPPFHMSMEAAQEGTLRKVSNLNAQNTAKPVLNFGGQNTELWCEGGEEQFVAEMVRQSMQFAHSCCWFSTLISKQAHVKRVHDALHIAAAVEVKTIPMGQGNKSSRVVAWTFLNKEQQQKWAETRWKEPTSTPEKH